MSLLDEVRKLEQQVVNRLKELEPLTREYEQLRKLAERLGVKYSPKPAQTDGDSGTSVTSRRGGTRAPARKAPAKARAKRSTAAAPAAKTAAKRSGARSSSRRRAATGAAAASPTAAATTGSKRGSARGRRAGRGRTAGARPGQRHDDVLRLVSEQPGITVREIGERLGVDPTGLYRVAKRLIDDGRLRKDGTGLYPGEPAAASPPPSEPATPQTPADGGAQAADTPASSEPDSSTTATDTPASRDT
jgi:hypothetical protein